MSPDDCPAASRARNMVFPLSTALDACPNLRGRECSALCVPMSIGGNSVGVFHVTAKDGTPPSDTVEADVEVVARRASERLAMLRAFEVSQTQANSDSFTGLMTRRSLEAAVRQLTPPAPSMRWPTATSTISKPERHVRARGRRPCAEDVLASAPGLTPARRHPGPLRGRGVRDRPPRLPAGGGPSGAGAGPRTPGRPDHRGGAPTFTVSFGVAASHQGEDFRSCRRTG